MREARERGISGTCQVLIEKEGVGISRVGVGVGVCEDDDELRSGGIVTRHRFLWSIA